MRLRLKKHLQSRLAVADNLLKVDTQELNSHIATQNAEWLDWKEVFHNDHPTCLEVGCGMGGFAKGFFEKFPEINLVAVEKLSNVIVSACEKCSHCTNVRFLNAGAEYLEKYIASHSIDTIYLNFSTPFQKKTYANRRLTYPRFLNMYQRLLKDGGKVIQKTDDDDFFIWSKEQFEKCNWQIIAETQDLHNSPYLEGNIVTEYEQKFLDVGKNINYVCATPPKE
ncbi:MAG: tRNA (guanosine(46)-N7)-methyltransferase TrmB [Clostridia bacterium]|nr:tRNA (guanosine(46)-N7)-methyltransferase TrmB [Clostridia bacterium]